MAGVVQVALLAEGVDRNGYEVNIAKLEQVALLAEGVDRNSFSFLKSPVCSSVALLAEGVDRNCWLCILP